MFEKQNALGNVWFVVHSSDPDEKLCGTDNEDKADKIVAALNAIKISDIADGMELAEAERGFVRFDMDWEPKIKNNETDSFFRILWRKEITTPNGYIRQLMSVKIKGGQR